jgi:hypothetical protein
MMPIDKYYALEPLVREILWLQWDPIGVNAHPEAASEYDNYAPAVVALLINGVGAQKLAQHLSRIARDRIGIESDPARDMAAAQALFDAGQKISSASSSN